MRHLPDLTGHRFGRLLVLGRHPENTAAGKRRWVCQCDCSTEVIAVGSNLLSGMWISCGCARTDRISAQAKTHGLSHTPEYRHWKTMRRRCYDSNQPDYARYGAKGIRVCNRWRNSFPNFLADMGPKPGPGYTIDRLDSTGNYAPDNCRWATPTEQGCNTSRVLRFTYKNETRPLSE